MFHPDVLLATQSFTGSRKHSDLTITEDVEVTDKGGVLKDDFGRQLEVDEAQVQEDRSYDRYLLQEHCPLNEHLTYGTHLTTTHDETLPLCTTDGEPITLPPLQQSEKRCLYRAEEHSPVSQQRVETPPLHGFHYNRGVHFIPFQIHDAQGQLHPARYTQLVITADPFVLAYRRGSDQQYGKSVHAEPNYDRPSPTYTNDDLIFLDQDSSYHESVDLACMAMNDLTAGYAAKEEELRKKMDKLDKIGHMRRECMLHLQRTDTIKHIKDKRDSYRPGVEEGQHIARLWEEIVHGRPGVQS
ncbi:hypothetical protein EDB86DRAFT_3083640 [Lactarius hatsudake]|nr:hypothetical protein EDB86DRAFT_3083640 [Lactarius hatsudake]